MNERSRCNLKHGHPATRRLSDSGSNAWTREAKKSGCGGFEAQREASDDKARALWGWAQDARMSPHQRGEDYLAAIYI